MQAEPATSNGDSTLVCPTCHILASPGAAFCGACGNALSSTVVPPSSSAPSWYYQLNGERNGPVSSATIDDLLARGIIDSSTNVWTQGMGAWVPLRSTPLAAVITAPPPLVSVNNAIVWWLALMPIIGALTEYAIASGSGTTLNDVWLVTPILNSVLAVWDERILKKAGHKVGLVWAILLVPVYLFRRSAVVDRNFGYSIVWVVSFLISLTLSGVLSAALPSRG